MEECNKLKPAFHGSPNSIRDFNCSVRPTHLIRIITGKVSRTLRC